MSPTFKLRLVRIAWLIALAAAGAALSAIYLIDENNPNGIVMLDQFGPGYRAYAVCAFAACLFSVLSVFLRHQVLVARQARNDQAAQKLLNSLLQSNAPVAGSSNFFVYLRSFETTGRLRPPFFFSLAVLQTLHTNELESFLALGLEKQGLLLGLGRPGENIGAARIRVADADWQADIEHLISHATGILLIPSAHEGTKWEIQRLQKESLIAKTIFIMPPKTHQFDWRIKWDQAAAALLEFSITLPEYQDHGLLFTINPKGDVNNARVFPLFFRRSLVKSVKRFLSGEQASGEEAVQRAKRLSGVLWFYGKWMAIVSYFVALPLLIGFGMTNVFAGTAARGVDPPPPWSTFGARYDAASEIGSGQSLVDWRIFFSRHKKLSESSIDRLARGGLLQLDDRQREDYLLGFGELLTYSRNESVCEALAQGRATELERTRTLVNLPASDVRVWLQARQSAAFAELRHPTPPSPADQPAAELRRTLAAALGVQEAQEVERLISAPGAPTDQQACRLGITGALAVNRLQEPYKAQWAMLLARCYSVP